MSNTIEHKDYISSVEYSNEDKCFFGKLEMIDDLVTFEADTVEGLEKNFQDSVDDYLSTCKKNWDRSAKKNKGILIYALAPNCIKWLSKALKITFPLNALVGKSLEEYIGH
ncbi:MAG: toxin-antitoxin system HicB family antitoxin [Candidatus Thiodubiliella endoseptemdiera]|uniref:Toxin-antitoxin system HicB family antitoxin n=1 Tax=Candidatus Thiodubiliella endoseptemdiera TaxID=2738886 RepID=A0A853F3T7_9GAMM|nr:toxin-antitoxin system HicB family antitoxin [Candidatus Thiodubiliella endoseptemdiera]